jgi:hypothetical protein
MRSVSVIAGLLASALLASCDSAREVSVADGRAAITRIARSSPSAALCKSEGRQALRQAVRDYTAALDREGRDFEPVSRRGRTAETIAIFGLVVGDVKVNDFRGEARETAQRILAVANSSDRVRALRTMHRMACAQTVAYVQSEVREETARSASQRRIERAYERGDYRRAGQLQERLSRRERIAERTSSSFEREIEWLLSIS